MVSTTSRTAAHTSLDVALLDLRRVQMHPRMLRWYTQQVGADVELARLRTLRAIEAGIEAGGGGAPGISDLAVSMAVDVSTASRLVEQAVVEGHVTRRSSQRDRRRTELELTEAGQHLLARATQVRAELMGHATRDWEDEDLMTLAELLGGLETDLRRLVDDEEYR